MTEPYQLALVDHQQGRFSRAGSRPLRVSASLRLHPWQLLGGLLSRIGVRARACLRLVQSSRKTPETRRGQLSCTRPRLCLSPELHVHLDLGVAYSTGMTRIFTFKVLAAVMCMQLCTSRTPRTRKLVVPVKECVTHPATTGFTPRPGELK